MIGKLCYVSVTKAPLHVKGDWAILILNDTVLILAVSRQFNDEVFALSNRGIGYVCKKYLTEL